MEAYYKIMGYKNNELVMFIPYGEVRISISSNSRDEFESEESALSALNSAPNFMASRTSKIQSPKIMPRIQALAFCKPTIMKFYK